MSHNIMKMIVDLGKQVKLQWKLQSKIGGLIESYYIFITMQNGSYDLSGHTHL